MNRKMILMFFGIFIFLVLSLVAVSAYARANPAYTQQSFGLDSVLGVSGGITGFDRSLCEAGQDFILQVAPSGCTPSVVRSDLLEEQNVPVFCPITATKLNPLIDVEAIDRIQLSFANGTKPQDVQGVTSYPARAALGRFGDQINSPVLDNIGYAVVVLKQQKNGTAVPDFVEGTLKARIQYDIENAFGVGQASFYLPEISDEEWDNNFRQYGFWDGRGYLRAEGIDEDRASISIYSDRETNGFGVTGDKRRVSTTNLRVGETTPNEIFIPGFEYCLGGLNLRLNSLENPDTRVRLNVNGNSLELTDGERFLENKCQVRDIDNQGIVQKTTISCNEDEGRKNFNLIISPKVNLSVDGNSREYEVGDFLYRDETNAEKSVYLAYLDTKGDSTSENNLFAVLVSIPASANKVKLTEDEVASFAGLMDRFSHSDITGNKFADSIISAGNFYIGAGDAILRNILKGDTFRPLSFGETEKIFGKDLTIKGYAGAVDAEISSSENGVRFRELYQRSVEDYETVIESFPEERYPRDRLKTLGEEALRKEIELAWGADQKRTATDLCEEFEDAYPNGALPGICNEAYKLSSSEPAVKDVIIDGRTKRISFDRIREPSLEEFGVKIFIRDKLGETFSLSMRRNEIIYLNESNNEFIQLVDIDSADSATIRGNIKARSGSVAVKEFLIGSTTQKLDIGETKTFGSDYAFTLQEVNLKKIAKVSVLPNINYARTEADFDFKIGIEKRGIQLSPEKTRERIETINATLEKWHGFNDKLGNVVSAGKTACLAVGGALTLKNFIGSLGGEGIARQKVMRGEGGWFEICKDRVNNGEFGSVDSCLLNNNDAIESGVDIVSKEMKTQNEQFENLQRGITQESFLGEDVVDTEKLGERYLNNNYRSELKTNLAGVNTIRVGNEDVPVSNIVDSINSDTTLVTQARDLQLNSRLLNSENERVRQVARSNIDATLGDIWVNSRAAVQEQSLLDTLSQRGLGGLGVGVYVPEGSIQGVYDGGKTSSRVGDIPADVPAQVIAYGKRDYVLQLEQVGLEDYRVIEVFDSSGVRLDNSSTEYKEITDKFAFKKFDRTTYENRFINPEIRYYETEPYRGLPAIVPFDVKDGWYASIKSTLPIGGGIRGFDDSGRVSSFYLCNVGGNGREEFNSGIGDDICQMINLGTNQPVNQFPGLDKGEASRLVTQAVRAIEESSRRYGAGVSQVSIFGQTIDVGEPAINIPDIQCQDFMPATDCNLIFNICDPVVCPSSRCDLGGAHPVRDVVQSGIAGSLALCLPNFPDVKVPICVAGVHAGIDGFLSVGDSYQQCLQTSLETGETVGICDEIYSVHMCEFFWRQGLPIAKVAAPQILGKVLGQNVRGGGEYLGVRDAFDKASSSADFFTQSYAANSFKAFKARSAEGVGTEVCKNWVSFTGPEGGNLLDALTAPDSPPQFHGRFDEIPFTTATNPPTSQYKVFYHVYSGNDFPAHFQVYLRDPTGSSFFQDTSFRRVVATGFINEGEFATETKDFTAPSGFSQMCIVVNGQEECGFKQVSTDFGVNYLADQYVASEAKRTDIKSESSCISGRPNVFSLANPNLQEGADEFINPEIFNRGITRVCATDNPGTGTDSFIGTESARWQEVGHCGETSLKCWLDTDSVKDTVRTTTVEDKILDEVSTDYIETLRKEGGFASAKEFDELVDEIESEEDSLEKVEKITETEGKVFHLHEKAYLKFLRANTYSNLALAVYELIRAPGQKAEDRPPENVDELIEQTANELQELESALSSGKGISPVFELKEGNGNPLTFFRGSKLFYVYFGNSWYWSESEDGEWNSVESAFVSESIENVNEENVVPADATNVATVSDRLSSGEKEFVLGLKGKSYSEGVRLLVEKADDDNSGISKSGLSTETVDFSADRIFTVKPEGLTEIYFEGVTFGGVSDVHLRFNFGERKWEWSMNEERWRAVSELLPVRAGVYVDGDLTETRLEFIPALDGKDFFDGAEIIFGIDTEDFSPGERRTTSSGTLTSTCSNTEGCRKLLGNEIMKLAQTKKQSWFDNTVEKDTGAKSFECLALQVAWVESRIRHCSEIHVDQNPLYCNGDKDELITGDGGSSLGIMQINGDVHGEKLNFEENVNFGINLLINGHDGSSTFDTSIPQLYRCYRPPELGSVVRQSDFQSVSYSGWERSIRAYNGWNSRCTKTDDNGNLQLVGNPHYVDDVLNSRDEIAELFPEACGS